MTSIPTWLWDVPNRMKEFEQTGSIVHISKVCASIIDLYRIMLARQPTDLIRKPGEE